MHPSSSATSSTGRALPAWRVAQRPARAVSFSRGGAISGSCSVTAPAGHPCCGQRQRRLCHTSRAGRPNAGRSTSSTCRSPLDHNAPPQTSQPGLDIRRRMCTLSGSPGSSSTPSTSTSPSPTRRSQTRVGSHSTGILQVFGCLSAPILGDPSRSAADSCCPYLHPQTRRGAKPSVPGADRTRPIPFNGGPGNCPAKQATDCGDRAAARSLQWRAGQTTAVLGWWWSTISLQWRAGQLPGQTVSSGLPSCPTGTFNGGPGNCPAKPTMSAPAAIRAQVLQWRAGQLPGQTSRASGVPLTRARILQWRAGQLPGQTDVYDVESFAEDDVLQWRAGQLPGQTWSAGCPSSCAPSPFNGGPGNCPTKPVAP